MPMNALKYTAHGEYIFSVLELNLSVKQLLEKHLGSVWVQGEVSGLSRPASGHLYFALKEAGGQIRCAFFRPQQLKSASHLVLEEGKHVLIKATVTLYPERGETQLVVEDAVDIGLGLLQQQFEALKATLAQAGLFDAAHKKPIPTWIHTLGVITSHTGAALHDVCAVLKRRWPLMNVVVYHSAVQGNDAPAQLRAALAQAEQENRIDALLITRGGGSLEDLFCFNDEAFVRALYASPLPLISAVGHEVDFTLCDFVADLRAPTPSAAAEMLSPNQDDFSKQLSHLNRELKHRLTTRLSQSQEALRFLKNRLKHPRELLQQKQMILLYLTEVTHKNIHNFLLKKTREYVEIEKNFLSLSPGEKILKTTQILQEKRVRIFQQLERRLFQHKHQLAVLSARLDTLSPLKTLARGYAIATHLPTHTVLTAATQAQPGDTLELQLSEGKLRCRVEG